MRNVSPTDSRLRARCICMPDLRRWWALGQLSRQPFVSSFPLARLPSPLGGPFFWLMPDMLKSDSQTHGLAISLRGVLVHGLITLLAVAIAFPLPAAAKYILFQWWPMVEADPNLLLGSEIVLASALVLLLNLAKLSWDNRYLVQMARTAALVYTRTAARSWTARWPEQRLLKRLPAVRDAFVLTLTGYDTFVDEKSLLRDPLEGAYELRVMLVNPVG